MPAILDELSQNAMQAVSSSEVRLGARLMLPAIRYVGVCVKSRAVAAAEAS